MTMIGHVEEASAKVQFTDVTRTAPGCCALCGRGQDDNGFIDTGLDYEFWGRLYFCSNCALQLAAVFGFISPEDYADLEAELNYTKLQLQQKTEIAESLKDAVRGLSIFNNSLSFASSDAVDDVEKPKSTELPKPESIPNTLKLGGESPKQSGTTGKSSGKSGFLNI